MNSLHLTEIASEIKAGLLTRRKEYTADHKNTKWLFQKTPWIRMYSNAIVAAGSNAKSVQSIYDQNANSTTQVGEQFIQTPTPFSQIAPFFNSSDREKSTLGITNSLAFRDTLDSVLRPNAGITHARIAAQGALGSTRSARIDFVCWTKEQLEFLEPYYFIPGMSVVLEWGWSVSSDGSPVVPLPIEYPILPDGEMRCKISKHRKQMHGDYDGMVGMVTNFVYILNDAGAWDCTVEIISPTDAFASTPLHSTAAVQCKDEDSLENRNTDETFAAWLRDITLHTDTWIKSMNLKTFTNKALQKPEKHIFQIVINAKTRDPNIQEDKPWFDSAGSFLKNANDLISETVTSTVQSVQSLNTHIFGSPHTIETYITFEYFVAMINANYTLKFQNGDSALVKLDIDGFFDPVTKKKSPGVQIGDDPFLTTTDPYICLLKGRPTILELPAKATNSNVQIPKFDGTINTILLNTAMLYELYKSSDDLKEYLNNVLENVSAACGNFFNFELQEPPEDQCIDKQSVVLTIVNTHLTNLKDKQPQAYEFAFANKEMRSIGVQSKMTEAMKSQALYGTNSSTQRESNDKSSTSERFYRLTGRGNEGLTKIVRNGAIQQDISLRSAIPLCPPGQVPITDNPRDSFIKAFVELTINRTDETAAAAGTALTTYFNEKNESTGPALKNKNLILPFNISVIIDGIGGIVWGNVIGVSDMLPTRLGSMFYYQVTTIEHEITDGKWETTLNTVPRYKT